MITEIQESDIEKTKEAKEEIKALYQIEHHYKPEMDRKKAQKLCEGWKKAVKATMMFK